MPCAPQDIRRSSRHLKAIRQLGHRVAAAGRRLTALLEVGAWGERAAARHLIRHGLIPVKRNWYAGRLEADIIAVDGNTIVVAEVKTRHIRFIRHHPAASAITPKKREHLERLGGSFVRKNGPLCRRFRLRHLRTDAVEVYYERSIWGLRRIARIAWQRGLERSAHKHP